MRLAIILFFSLIFLHPSSAVLSEYSFMLPENHPLLVSFLSAPSCPNLDSVEIGGLDETYASAFPDSFALYRSSSEKIAYAKSAASIQPLLSLSPYFISVNIVCFKYAVGATNDAVLAVRSAFETADKKLSEYEFMTDGSEGLNYEISEIRKKLVNKEKGGTSLGGKLVLASEKLDALWSGLPSRSDFSVLNLLKSRNSILNDIFILNKKASVSIEEINAALSDADSNYSVLLNGAERSLSTIRSENPDAIDEEKISALLSSYIVSPSASSRSVLEEISFSEKTISEAKVLHSLSESALKEKRRGYASISLRKKAESIGLLKRALSGINSTDARISSFEERLDGIVVLRETEAKKLLSSKSSNPFTYSVISSMLSEYNRLSKARLPSAKGERIRFRIQQVSLLDEAIGAGSAEDSQLFVSNEVSSQISELKMVLQKAKKDELDVSYENEMLKSIEDAFLKLKSENDFPNASDFLLLLDKLSELKDSVLQTASAEYGGLESDYVLLKKISPNLDGGFGQGLSEFERFFTDGRIDFENAFGKLANIRESFSKMLSEAEVKAPIAIRGSMEKNLRMSKTILPAEIGKESEILLYVSTENEFDLDYGGKISLELPSYVPASSLVNSSAGVSLEFMDGKPVLSISSPEEKDYFAIFSFKMRVSEIVSEGEETVLASSPKAEKIMRVVFDAPESAPVLFERHFPVSSSILIKSSLPFSSSESISSENEKNLAVVIDAEKGRNEFDISYSTENPFSFDRAVETVSDFGNSTSFSYSLKYSNVFSYLQNVLLSFSEPSPCSLKKLAVSYYSPGLSVKDRSSERFVSLEISARSWSAFEEREIVFSVECNDILEDAVRQKLSDVELLAQASKNSSISDSQIIDAKQLAVSGNYKSAMDKLLSAEKALLKEAELNQTAVSSETERLEIVNWLGNAKSTSETLKSIDLKSFSSEISALERGIKDVSNLFGKEKLAEAQKAIVETERTLKSLASEKADGSSAICRSIKCDDASLLLLSEMKKQFLIGNYSSVFLVSKDFEGAIANIKAERESEFLSKKNLFSNYSSEKRSAETALSDFSAYFSASDSNIPFLSRLSTYKKASSASSVLQKQMEKLDVIFSAMQNNERDKIAGYSFSTLSAELSKFHNALQDLSDANSGMKTLAETELELASKKQVQFGNEKTGKQLQDAQQSARNSNFFTAYSVASSINQAGLFASAISSPKENSPPFLIIGLAVLFLAVLAYLFIFRENKKEIVATD